MKINQDPSILVAGNTSDLQRHMETSSETMENDVTSSWRPKASRVAISNKSRPQTEDGHKEQRPLHIAKEIQL